MREFLRARWSNLALLTYDVDPALLAEATPPECELDLRDNRAFVSLVAFDFLDTRVMGLGWPGHRNFPEINLRFYVHHRGERGVCFIKEFVPRRVIAAMARLFYNEPYRVARMNSAVIDSADVIIVEHRLTVAGVSNTLRIVANKPATRPNEMSLEHFFKEHEWGFGKNRRGQLLRYSVRHPIWDVYPIQSYELKWDWGSVYGPEWAFLHDRAPISVTLAAGSQVSVYPVNAGS